MKHIGKVIMDELLTDDVHEIKSKIRIDEQKIMNVLSVPGYYAKFIPDTADSEADTAIIAVQMPNGIVSVSLEITGTEVGEEIIAENSKNAILAAIDKKNIEYWQEMKKR